MLLAGFRVRPVGDLVSQPYIGMTEDVLAAFADGGTEYAVEPDASAASYFYGAAALFDGGRVAVAGLGPRSRQGDLAFTAVLASMGAAVERGEPVAVRGGPSLSGVAIDLRHTPDVAPTLAAVAVFANSPTTVAGISFTRGHETDRIKAVVTELRRLGLEADEHDDGFTVHPGEPRPVEPVETYGDHRMAMSFALLGLRVPGLSIKNPGCVAKTFPGYWAALDGLRR
jgi:3-phosphoshikimate 1-carboxyvinyltransferase